MTQPTRNAYEIQAGHLPGHPFNVVNTTTGRIIGCHTNKPDASSHLSNALLIEDQRCRKLSRKKEG